MPTQRKKKVDNEELGCLEYAFMSLIVSTVTFKLIETTKLPYKDLWLASFIVLMILCVLSIPILLIKSRRDKQRRIEAWHNAFVAYEANRSYDGPTPAHCSIEHLTPAQLEVFAAKLYDHMGYRSEHSGKAGDHGVDVLLMTPDNGIEIVQCKHWSRPVGEPVVRDFYGAMLHLKAERGWIWAPNGFSSSAWIWARGKPIVLVDNREITRLVVSAYRERS